MDRRFGHKHHGLGHVFFRKLRCDQCAECRTTHRASRNDPPMLAKNSLDVCDRELAAANHSCPFLQGLDYSVAEPHANGHALSLRALRADTASRYVFSE